MIQLPPPPVSRLIGFVLKSIEPGHAIFEMEADERHHNPMGTLHGGIYCDIADAAMGFAYAATLAEGETFTTIELKINFLGAVRKATLTAEARVVKAGSTLGYVECEVKDQTGKLVAKASSTCMKLRQDRAGLRVSEQVCLGSKGTEIWQSRQSRRTSTDISRSFPLMFKRYLKKCGQPSATLRPKRRRRSATRCRHTS